VHSAFFSFKHLVSLIKKGMKHAAKKFLKRPEFPGGKEAFRAFVKKQLVYPEEALRKKLEGTVYLSVQIDDNGKVRDVTVDRGIGSGCDEEAIRLIKSVRFGAVKNSGIRLKTWQRFRIEFRLPLNKRNINYHIKKSSETNIQVQKKKTQSYSYTININTKD
jgi:TonB family protein